MNCCRRSICNLKRRDLGEKKGEQKQERKGGRLRPVAAAASSARLYRDLDDIHY